MIYYLIVALAGFALGYAFCLNRIYFKNKAEKEAKELRDSIARKF